ncbi:MAG: class I SAM-dependent methyltransferase [Candidatus Solibacter sp.]
MPIWLAPPAIKSITRHAGAASLRVLDVGCGFGSARTFKQYLPDCEYHGLDRTEEYLYPEDKGCMYRFYQANLEEDSLDTVPDGYFDAIVLSHVIEHLINGEKCLQKLALKLKPGGIIYIEYPGVRSLNVPHARSGFLHFHDDPTHVRVYSVAEVSNIMLRAGCDIIRGGTRRDGLRLLLTPILALRGLIKYRHIWSGRLWDVFGIAEVVVARRR